MREALLRVREVNKRFGVRIFIFTWPLSEGAT